MTTPTDDAYSELQQAFDFFNVRLFDGQLPPVLITLQRNRRTYGYFSAERFGRRDGVRSHEIAINPVYFAVSPIENVLSTLVHEQVHLWQYAFGECGRRCYHNKEFAKKMRSIGLQPSSTGQPGGKETGEKMDHYIIDGGPFQIAAKELMHERFVLSWYDRFPPADARPAVSPPGTGGEIADELDEAGDELEAEDGAGEVAIVDFEEVPENRSNRVKYTCPGCFINAWGKPGLELKCVPCDSTLEVNTA